MMRLRYALLIAAVLLAASAIAGVAQPQLGRSAAKTAATPAKTITVSGHGTVTTVPDRASFDFTVDTRAQTAAGALGRNADAATAVVAALKNAGVAAADIQTSQVYLSPQTSENGTSIIGYAASTSIAVNTTIAKAGSIIDAAVGAGADGVSGPSLSHSDEDALYRDALKNAVSDARDKAAALASAAGLTLGGAQTVVEGGGQTPIPFAAGAKAADSSVTIEPGTQTIEANVTVTYAAS
jgi:uncharacterized protein YggE